MAESSQAAASTTQSSTSTAGSESAPDAAAAAAAAAAAGGDGKTVAASNGEFLTLLGDEYGKNEAFKDFKDPKDLAKSYLDLKGKPPTYAPPPADATAEQKAAYAKAAGVPDDAKGYGFAKPENWPEGMEYSDEHALQWADKMHKLGVPAAMANDLRNQFLAEVVEGATTQATEANKLLDESFTKMFGDQKGVVTQRVKDVLTAAIPDTATRTALEKGLSNEALLAIAAIHEHDRKTYGQADTNGDDGSKTAAKSLDELRAEGQKMMATDAYRDPMHKDHAATRKTVNETYQQIGALTEAAKKK